MSGRAFSLVDTKPTDYQTKGTEFPFRNLRPNALSSGGSFQKKMPPNSFWTTRHFWGPCVHQSSLKAYRKAKKRLSGVFGRSKNRAR